MEPFTEKEREEIRRLQSEGYSYLEAVAKIRGIQSFEVMFNGESIPLKSIKDFLGGIIVAKSNIFQKVRRIPTSFVFRLIFESRLPKIKRPPQPNRRKKKKSRRRRK